MQDFREAFVLAGHMLASADPGLLEIVLRSLGVSLTAVAAACVIGMPVGAAVAFLRFPGRRAVAVILNALMGLPPVVVGLLVYMALSNAGPLGVLGLLYTPTAMVIAQAALVTPLVAALTRETVAQLAAEYDEAFRSMVVPRHVALGAFLWDGRGRLLTVALAGFGRAIAEVGAVIVVGGNIDHLTRVMTTAIALETSKGDLALALALGFVLLLIAIAVNAAVMGLRPGAAEARHA